MYSPRNQQHASSVISTPVRQLARKFDAGSWKVESSLGDSNSGFFTPRQGPNSNSTSNFKTKWTPSKSSCPSAFMTPKQTESPTKRGTRAFCCGLPFDNPESPSDFETPKPCAPLEVKRLAFSMESPIKPALVMESDADSHVLKKTEKVKTAAKAQKKKKKSKKKSETKEERRERLKNETPEEKASRKARKERRKAKRGVSRSNSESTTDTLDSYNLKTYSTWEFGKPKTFVRPEINEETTKAAILIQKIARGGWQRMKFRVQLLQHKLDTREERTAQAIDKVWDETQEKKDRYFDIVYGKSERKMDKRLARERAKRDQGQQIISHLRKDNKAIRSKNTKLAQDILEYAEHNERLSKAADRALHNIDDLKGHVKRFQETHDQLQKVLPMYKGRVEIVEELAEERQQYCLAEHNSKVLYMKCVANIVEMIEDQCDQPELVEEVVSYLLSM